MFNELYFGKTNIDDFIKTHNHINYCEAIIYPDGDITYAVPSHQMALLNIMSLPIEDAGHLIPLEASPVHWLIDQSRCISVWTAGYMKPTGEELFYPGEERTTRKERLERYEYICTEKQLQSLRKLVENKLVRDCSIR